MGVLALNDINSLRFFDTTLVCFVPAFVLVLMGACLTALVCTFTVGAGAAEHLSSQAA